MALANNDVALARELIEKNRKLMTSRDVEGNTVLHLCKSPKMMAFLLATVRKIEKDDIKHVYRKNAEGRLPIQEAMEKKDLVSVLQLIRFFHSPLLSTFSFSHFV